MFSINGTFENGYFRHKSVAGPGFPEGARRLRGGRQGPMRQLCGKLVCKNERIWVLRGRAPAAPPLDPPMQMMQHTSLAMEYPR